ncbi:DUF2520 domain-containing protein [Sphingobacterium shayense]|uniref:Rossmann-like and DUF2520 domain-containing protein n=1 Tax=Sphingobacterium shayense TaxID=626343 RepID=UPI00155646DA|nr:Rossmann-like and DUF2520 domain-containing protein [Sphingobacterium shayense]NQD72681.1 DUF2520 domain-containing protein [Sphingobacterium shayense]
MEIVVIGSGNIATHLAKGLHALGHTILQVYSKNIANAHALASLFSASATDQLNVINPSASLYLIAVTDKAIQDITTVLPKSIQGIITHTSGATPISILQKFSNYGVIYPAQSLTKGISTNLNDVPFGIEGSNKKVSATLVAMMLQLSTKTFPCSTQQRLALHTAAVFANNFSNALFQIAYEIMNANNLSFDLLKPLILETAKKVQDHLPSEAQTGPAKRNDIPTIQRHLQFLSQNPNWVKIYQQLTEEISSKSNI